MAILAECPTCHRKQANKNRICQGCSEDLIKAKRSTRVKYWISYRIDNKQRREAIGYSLQDAQAAEGKRKAQKREGRVLEMLPESKITFSELTYWYLNLKSVKGLKTLDRVKTCLKNFNDVFGNTQVNKIKLEALENYQIERKELGRSPATIDMEVKYAQTVITKAFDNDKIDVAPLKAFRRTKRKLKKGANARHRKLSIEEYNALLAVSPEHLKKMLIVAMNTGMRLGEIRLLKWSHIDKETGFVRLKAEDTKEKKGKNVPINRNVQNVLDETVRHIDHDYVFVYQGKPIKQKAGPKWSLRTACKKAGIEYGRKAENGITFHDFRRTVKTNMLVAGVDKTHIDVILGHALQGIDTHYIILEDRELKSAMNIYTKWLDLDSNKLNSVDQNVDQDQKRN